MSKLYRTIVWLVLFTLITACAAPPTVVPTKSVSPLPQITQQPTEETLPPIKIDRHPAIADYSHLHPQLTAVPTYDPKSKDAWQVAPQIDLREQDLTQVNILNSLSDLMSAAFDTKTQWPAANLLPSGFDPQKIMEIGKDPGLGVRALHEQGITGKGVGIAIINQTLLVDHVEYKDQIRVYEETKDVSGETPEAQMHGPGIASIIVGKNIGVAPEADLYYMATSFCGEFPDASDHSCLIEAMRRVLEINHTLPTDRKIKVLSLSSIYFNAKSKDISSAVKEVEDAGIFVVDIDLYESHNFHFEGLGRLPTSDPNQFEAYLPPPFYADYLYAGFPFQNTLLIPMDSRTVASPTGVNDYSFYRWGDHSWAIAYLTGAYALAAQVKPDITPQLFWETAMKTGRTIQVQHNDKSYELGVILDPQALIKALQAK